ncbi:hypothetical protein LLEC1_07158 [Akanthomyces lecanii]|uniref:VIT domain-containing protein n=1 Tax=Cordyceps confragosa TaxID=2714763 RepID=A0A179IMT4_CORDF|nr:hypothetical protein LLEC1_07158 [Akanthomyces lecanii]
MFTMRQRNAVPGLGFAVDPREPLPPHFLRAHRFHPEVASPPRGPDPGGDAAGREIYAPHQTPHAYYVATTTLPKVDLGHDKASSIAQFEHVLLPPMSSSVAVHVVHDTATITITQTFENNSSVNIDHGCYQFPLPHGAAVVDFRCRIGDSTVLKGVVKSKEEARRAFRDAVRRSRPAGLLEQDTPEIFKTSIGNVPARATATADLTFISFLKHDFLPAGSVSQTTISIPTYIAPRYGSAPIEILETGPRGPDRTVSVQIEVLTAEEIVDIRSDTHKIEFSYGGARKKCQQWADFLTPQVSADSTLAVVNLADELACLDGDFVVSISTRPAAGSEVPIACMETHPSLENHRALMITIPPKFMLQSVAPNEHGEIIFLADRSGSMDDKMTGLKSAMEFFIHGIPESRNFNIWCFGTSYTSLWSKSRPFTQDTMIEALRYVSSNFESDMGGTELLPALRAIVSARDTSKAMDIVVLTDGEVWMLDETINFVTESRRNRDAPLRCFALGIGNAVSRALVEGIAAAGGGYAEIIPNDAIIGGWEDRLVAVLSAASSGHCGHLSVELDNVSEETLKRRNEVEIPTIQTSPVDVSALSPFTRNRIFYLFEGEPEQSCQSVVIKITDAAGNEVRKTIPVLNLHDRDLKLHKFAARALLGDLESRQSSRGWPYAYRRFSHAATADESTFLRQEGVRLGCKWSLASKWTSFLAVEEESEHLDQPDQGLLRARNPFSAKVFYLKGGSAPGDQRLTDIEISDASSSSDGSDLDDAEDHHFNRWDSRPALRVVGGAGAGGQLLSWEPSSSSLLMSRRSSSDSGGSLPSGNARAVPRKFSRESDSSPSVQSFSVTGSERHRQGSRSPELRTAAAMEPTGSVPDMSQKSHPHQRSIFRQARSWSSEIPTIFKGSEDRLNNSTARAQTVEPASPTHQGIVDDERRQSSDSVAGSLAADPGRTASPNPPSPTIVVNRSIGGKAFVRNIIRFQQADGSFHFCSRSEIWRTVGDEFLDKLDKFREVSQVVAVTALLVAVLESKLRLCQGLWVLAVEKAKRFVCNPANLPSGLAPADVLKQAQALASAMGDLEIDEKGNIRRDSNSPVELVAAPLSL